jgi:beta-glucosidase-like glycosyl hydrolase
MPDLERKLYQLIISRINGEKIPSSSYSGQAVELARKGIGGFIFFGGKKDEVKGLIDRLQASSKIPLFIASDIERGAGQQIEGAAIFPSQMAVSAAINRDNPDDLKILKAAVAAVAREAVDIGINMPLIPVLDVNINPDNPIICTRAFSDDPRVVSEYGVIYIKILEESGLISCAKHFPGHGDTAVDSHISLPVISRSLKALKDSGILPFGEAIKAGVRSIMIGHLSVPAIDALPASLSKKVITGLLREDLRYKGLILTDALNMHALNEFEDVPAKCVNAGVDILLHPADADSTVNELELAVKSGEIKEELIDVAVQRILKYKSGIRDIKRPEINYHKHAELSSSISDKSITLLKEKPGFLPLKDIQGVSLVFDSDENKHDLSVLKNFIPGHISIKDHKAHSIRKTVIIALFTSIAAWEGSSGIKHENINIIRKIIKKSYNSVVISFGSPYVLRHFSEADMLIAAYDTNKQAQSSVIKCLKGEKDFTGSLPVNLSLL